jgi:MoaA/NifB/PqqE/SkfB family radical SAM enzyme
MSDPLSFAMSIGSYLLHKRLKHVIVHVTTKCNFRCEHCFIDFDGKKDLAFEDFERLARDMGKLFWLDIGGGEPFLRKDLPKIITCFEKKVCHIPTNASLKDQILDAVKEIKKNHRKELIIGISLDGLEKTHDKIRGKKGNWNQVWETHEALKKIEGVSVKITTVISQSNFDEIIPLMHEVQKQKVDFHSVILLRGSPLNPSIALPSLEKLEALGQKMWPILEKYNYGKSKLSSYILQNFHRHLWNTSLKIIKTKSQVIPCLAGQCHAVVMGDGKVSSCEMLAPVGDLRENSFKEILASPKYRKQLQDICEGKCHCTHNCALLPSIFYNPRNYLKLLKP